MLWVEIRTDDFEPLVNELREFDRAVRDVTPLANDIAVEMAVQNAVARLDGVDRDGYPFQPLAESTWRRHPYRGDGEPLDPMGMDSRIIKDFRVGVIDLGLGAADVVGSWPTMDDFIIYHIQGTRYMPSRDPSGITPAGWAAIGDAFDSWMSRVAGV
jgi:hypothetical protein